MAQVVRERTREERLAQAARVTAATLRRRGYELPDAAQPPPKFLARKGGDTISVVVGAAALRPGDVAGAFAAATEEVGTAHALLVVDEPAPDVLPPSWHAAAAAVKGRCELFSLAEMQADILEHELVPKYLLLPPGEAQAQLLAKVAGVQQRRVDDAAVRRLGARPGDLLLAVSRPHATGALQAVPALVVAKLTDDV